MSKTTVTLVFLSVLGFLFIPHRFFVQGPDQETQDNMLRRAYELGCGHGGIIKSPGLTQEEMENCSKTADVFISTYRKLAGHGA